jgi:hypothetical protein
LSNMSNDPNPPFSSPTTSKLGSRPYVPRTMFLKRSMHERTKSNHLSLSGTQNQQPLLLLPPLQAHPPSTPISLECLEDKVEFLWISMARAKGLCIKCGKPWPCVEHFKPRRQIRMMDFKGQTLTYSNVDELADEICRIESCFQDAK